MPKFFQKLGNNQKEADEGANVNLSSNTKTEEELQVAATQQKPDVTSSNETEITEEPVCEGTGNDDDACSHVATPVVVESNADTATCTSSDAIAPTNTDTASYDQRVAISLGITAVSSTLALLLVAYNVFFRRKQRRQRAVWRKDNKLILTKVEDLVEQLDVRDMEVDVLEQKVKTLEETSVNQQAQLEKDFTDKLQAKQAEYDKLQAKVDDLRQRRTETDARLEQVVVEVQKYAERQQDHDCQLLEQKLQASQLEQALAERDARLEQLQKRNTTQTARIEELQQKAKSDATKAETIIKNISSERDDRFSVLQQENDAIKTTIMGLLRQTQEKYDADKVLLKKEMRKRDDRIRMLQDELWKSNALLKRLQGTSTIDEKLSQSVRNLITSKETKEDDDITTAAGGGNRNKKERRGSTYEAAETILEGEADCAELTQLQNLLST